MDNEILYKSLKKEPAGFVEWDIHLTLQSVLLIPICSSMSQNIKHN